MWGKLHRELIVITIISVLILAVSFAFNFSASQKDILERQTYDYLLDAASPSYQGYSAYRDPAAE